MTNGKRKARTAVTVELFNKARMLLELNIPVSKVEDILGLSSSTCSRIARATTWEEYCAIKLKDAMTFSKKAKEQTQEPKEAEHNGKPTVPELVLTAIQQKLDTLLVNNTVLREEVKELRESVQWIANNAVVKVVEPNPTKRKRFF